MNHLERSYNLNLTPRRLLAVGLLGLAALAGCTDKDSTTEPIRTTTPIVAPFESDGNCRVSTAMVGLSSNTEQSIREFAESYVEHLGKESGTNLSTCVDEVIVEALRDRSNINQGLGSPDSVANSVSLPASVTALEHK